jgi:hypothetical protein
MAAIRLNEDYQRRVVAEKADLDDRRAKLSTFIDSATFSALDSQEQERMRRQLVIMGEYSGVLGERINAFQ